MSVHPSSLRNFQTNSKVGFLYLTEDACLKIPHNIFGINGYKKEKKKKKKILLSTDCFHPNTFHCSGQAQCVT